MKVNFFLFNIEGYGELFSGITPVSQQISSISVQSVPIITKVMSSSLVHGDVYSIHNCVIILIKFVSDLRQVAGFLLLLRFPPPIKLTA
jgi:hypothetical protein